MIISKVTVSIALFLIVLAGLLVLLFVLDTDKAGFIISLVTAFLMGGGAEWLVQKPARRSKRKERNPLID